MSIQWHHIYILIFLAGTASLILLTPAAQKAAAKFDIMDRPSGEKHKFHGKATPLLGGAAMLTGWLLMIIAGLIFISKSSGIALTTDIKAYFPGAFSVIHRVLFLISGAVLATALAAAVRLLRAVKPVVLAV